MKTDNSKDLSKIEDEMAEETPSSIADTLTKAYDDQTNAGDEIVETQEPSTEEGSETTELPLDNEADFEAFKTIFEPFQDDLKAAGMNELQACELLLNIHHALREDPTQTVHWLADHYGVVLNQEVQKDEALPKFIKAQLEHMNKEKTEEGHIKFPHLEELKSEIETCLTSGRARDVISAYEMSIWSHPNYRQEKIAEIRNQIESEKEAEFEARQMGKEKAAALNLTQKGKRNISGEKGRSAKDTMALIFDQINN